MRDEATKRFRARNRIASKYISRALSLRTAGGDIADMIWSLSVSGQPVPLIAYPHRQTRQGEADAVAARGSTSFAATFTRLLPLEVAK